MLKKAMMTVLALSFTVLVACSKVNMDNYEKLKVGMDYDEVEGILGGPSSCDEKLGARVCVWGGDDTNITVTFLGTKATVYSHKGLN